MISAIIFDVDGTLAETEEVHRQAFNLAFEQAGLDWRWDEALYRQLLQVTGGKERILHFAATHTDLPRADAERLAPQLHATKTAIYTGYVDDGAIPLRPGIADFIEAADRAGLRLAIATTTSMPNVISLLTSAFGARWPALFPVIAAGDMVPRKKPAPDIYQLALQQLGLPPEQCVAIEDSRNGVLSATGAGLRVIVVRSLYGSEDDVSGATQVLASPTELTLDTLARLCSSAHS
ncbi:HAD superfamily hydrolase (TIGR01509 family) [Rhodopseudomonas faecalis]|uniref:HAD superfamily hydrolase (TIGR01509 family) n=1 Tax=Rhodopseudomonas faecalis TaxID=99655 RepID=A0A318TKH4_9BRAD|nr:HAD-IA family hydrolase [Rhodopseudomonas faecalis]PYF03638.1 HAD superfamily hydrolase (TIGR01509 family) [Rhodopseudomonas faecalis]